MKKVVAKIAVAIAVGIFSSPVLASDLQGNWMCAKKLGEIDMKEKWIFGENNKYSESVLNDDMSPAAVLVGTYTVEGNAISTIIEKAYKPRDIVSGQPGERSHYKFYLAGPDTLMLGNEVCTRVQ